MLQYGQPPIAGAPTAAQNGMPIKFPSAYDLFPSNKRSSWLDDLQAKIQKGLNPPPSPGPSRSPSPIQVVEEEKEEHFEIDQIDEPLFLPMSEDQDDDQEQGDVDQLEADEDGEYNDEDEDEGYLRQEAIHSGTNVEDDAGNDDVEEVYGESGDPYSEQEDGADDIKDEDDDVYTLEAEGDGDYDEDEGEDDQLDEDEESRMYHEEEGGIIQEEGYDEESLRNAEAFVNYVEGGDELFASSADQEEIAPSKLSSDVPTADLDVRYTSEEPIYADEVDDEEQDEEAESEESEDEEEESDEAEREEGEDDEEEEEDESEDDIQYIGTSESPAPARSSSQPAPAFQLPLPPHPVQSQSIYPSLPQPPPTFTHVTPLASTPAPSFQLPNFSEDQIDPALLADIVQQVQQIPLNTPETFTPLVIQPQTQLNQQLAEPYVGDDAEEEYDEDEEAYEQGFELPGGGEGDEEEGEENEEEGEDNEEKGEEDELEDSDAQSEDVERSQSPIARKPIMSNEVIEIDFSSDEDGRESEDDGERLDQEEQEQQEEQESQVGQDDDEDGKGDDDDLEDDEEEEEEEEEEGEEEEEEEEEEALEANSSEEEPITSAVIRQPEQLRPMVPSGIENQSPLSDQYQQAGLAEYTKLPSTHPSTHPSFSPIAADDSPVSHFTNDQTAMDDQRMNDVIAAAFGAGTVEEIVAEALETIPVLDSAPGPVVDEQFDVMTTAPADEPMEVDEVAVDSDVVDGFRTKGSLAAETVVENVEVVTSVQIREDLFAPSIVHAEEAVLPAPTINDAPTDMHGEELEPTPSPIVRPSDVSSERPFNDEDFISFDDTDTPASPVEEKSYEQEPVIVDEDESAGGVAIVEPTHSSHDVDPSYLVADDQDEKLNEPQGDPVDSLPDPQLSPPDAETITPVIPRHLQMSKDETPSLVVEIPENPAPSEIQTAPASRTESPVIFPNPQVSPPDNTVALPSVSLTLLAREDRTPSLTVKAPEEPQIDPHFQDVPSVVVSKAGTPVSLPESQEPLFSIDTSQASDSQRLQPDVTRSPSLAIEVPLELEQNVFTSAVSRSPTPPALPDPRQPPPDSEMIMPVDLHDTAPRSPSSTSLIVEPPADPRPTYSFSTPLSRAETPTNLPDPALPPPDSYLEAPITPHEMEPSDSPTPSMRVEPPAQPPVLVESAAPSPENADETPSSPTGTPADEDIDMAPVKESDDRMQSEASGEDTQKDDDTQSENPLENSSSEMDSTAVEIEEEAINEPAVEVNTIHGEGSDQREQSPADTDYEGQREASVAIEAEAEPRPRLLHQHGSSSAIAVPQIAPHRRQTRAQARTSMSPALLEPPVTRSHCYYEKLRVTDDELTAVLLTPHCTLFNASDLEKENAEIEGQPTAQEEGEASKQQMTHDNSILQPRLTTKIRRIVGAQVFDEGCCYVLYAHQDARLPLPELDSKDTLAPASASMNGTRHRKRLSTASVPPTDDEEITVKVQHSETPRSQRRGRLSTPATANSTRRKKRASSAMSTSVEPEVNLTPSKQSRNRPSRGKGKGREASIISEASLDEGPRLSPGLGTPSGLRRSSRIKQEEIPEIDAIDSKSRMTSPALNTTVTPRRSRRKSAVRAIDFAALAPPATETVKDGSEEENQKEKEEDTTPMPEPALKKDDGNATLTSRRSTRRPRSTNQTDEAAYRPAEEEEEVVASDTDQLDQVDEEEQAPSSTRRKNKRKELEVELESSASSSTPIRETRGMKRRAIENTDQPGTPVRATGEEGEEVVVDQPDDDTVPASSSANQGRSGWGGKFLKRLRFGRG